MKVADKAELAQFLAEHPDIQMLELLVAAECRNIRARQGDRKP